MSLLFFKELLLSPPQGGGALTICLPRFVVATYDLPVWQFHCRISYRVYPGCHQSFLIATRPSLGETVS